MNAQVREAAQNGLSAKGWSQLELAKRAGMRQATVSRLLTGERQGEPETWGRLLAALELKLVAIPLDADASELERRG